MYQRGKLLRGLLTDLFALWAKEDSGGDKELQVHYNEAMVCKRIRIFLFIICVHIMFFSCARESKDNGDNVLKVAATTGFVADMVRAVMGEKAEVVQIMQAGLDPHTYVPTRTDIVDIYYADLVVYSGIHLEGGMYTAFNRMKDNPKLIELGDGLGRESIRDEGKGIDDPHIWMDVNLWQRVCLYFLERLSDFDAENAGYYKDRGMQYLEKLDVLDADMRRLFAAIPKEKRVLITSHDAFGYFGASYGFDVHGIQGISTVAESSLKHMSLLLDIIEERKVSAVFAESTISPKYLRALIEGAKSRGVILDEGGQLFADSLGAPDSGQGNYEGMMRFNAQLITQALTKGIEYAGAEDE